MLGGGAGGGRDRAARRRRPGLLDPRQEGRRGEPVDERRRGPRRSAAAPGASRGDGLLHDRPGRDPQAGDRGVAGAGDVPEVGGRDHALAARAQLVREQSRGAGRRARSSRRRAASAGPGRAPRRAPPRSASSRASRARRCSPVSRTRAAPVPSRSTSELVAVGAVAGEATLEVALEPVGELAHVLVGVGDGDPGAVARATPRRSIPSRAARSAKRSASSSTACARRSRTRRPARPAPGPTPPARPARHGRRGFLRAARCAGPGHGEYSPRSAARAGQRAATSWSMCERRNAGGPLTSSRRSGRKTLTSGRKPRSRTRSTGAPSALMRLRGLAAPAAGAEADGELVWFVALEQLDRRRGSPRHRNGPARARCGCGASARCSRSRWPRAGCLAGPVGAVDDAQVAAEPGLARV